LRHPRMRPGNCRACFEAAGPERPYARSVRGSWRGGGRLGSRPPSGQSPPTQDSRPGSKGAWVIRRDAIPGGRDLASRASAAVIDPCHPPARPTAASERMPAASSRRLRWRSGRAREPDRLASCRPGFPRAPSRPAQAAGYTCGKYARRRQAVPQSHLFSALQGWFAGSFPSSRPEGTFDGAAPVREPFMQ
jgi:hypothetical protein